MDFSTLLADCELTDDPFVLDLSELLRRLRGISDHRHRRGLRYPLRLLLSIAILAKMAGHHYPQAIAEWARLRTDELCTLLGFRRGKMPSLKTWDRVFAGAIDPDQLEQVVSEFLREQVQDQSPATGLRSIAIDGKTLRGTIRIGRSNGVHLLAIYLPKEGVVLAQAEIGVKTNELGAAAPLLAQINPHGMVLTGDAMFTQRELSVQVIEGGGDYLWKVKNNQAKLRDAITTLFTPQPVTPGWGQNTNDFTTAHQLSKGHGRIEERTITVSSMLQGYSDWPHLAQVFKLESTATQTNTGQVTHTVSYGVTSLSAQVADAGCLLKLVRSHWGIESGLHYRRDVTLEEDKARVCTEHAPHIHAILNNVVLALFHRHGPKNMAQAQREAIYSLERCLATLSLALT